MPEKRVITLFSVHFLLSTGLITEGVALFYVYNAAA